VDHSSSVLRYLGVEYRKSRPREKPPTQLRFPGPCDRGIGRLSAGIGLDRRSIEVGAPEPAEFRRAIYAPLSRDDAAHHWRKRRRAHHESVDPLTGKSGQLSRGDSARHPSNDRHYDDVPSGEGERCPGRLGGSFPEPPPSLSRSAQHEPGAQHDPEPRIDDEESVAVEPARAERHEPTHAVRVESIEHRVGEHRDACQEKHLARDDSRGERRPSQPAHESIEQDDGARKEERQDDDRGNAVGPSPPKRQVGGRSVEVGQSIDVGQVSADQQRDRRVRRAPAESTASQRGAEERVANRVYGCLVSRSGE
jgi:hypothetical protein